MPALGESVTEGTITRWLKSEGDQVEVDEPLLEVSTDKVDTEIPSPYAGVLTKILAQEDEEVEVGAELAYIGGDAPAEDSEAATEPEPEPKSEPEAPAQQAPEEPASEREEQKATEQPSEERAQQHQDAAGIGRASCRERVARERG